MEERLLAALHRLVRFPFRSIGRAPDMIGTGGSFIGMACRSSNGSSYLRARYTLHLRSSAPGAGLASGRTSSSSVSTSGFSPSRPGGVACGVAGVMMIGSFGICSVSGCGGGGGLGELLAPHQPVVLAEPGRFRHRRKGCTGGGRMARRSTGRTVQMAGMAGHTGRSARMVMVVVVVMVHVPQMAGTTVCVMGSAGRNGGRTGVGSARMVGEPVVHRWRRRRWLLLRPRYARVPGAQLPVVLVRCAQIRRRQLVEVFAFGRRGGRLRGQLLPQYLLTNFPVLGKAKTPGGGEKGGKKNRITTASRALLAIGVE
uniref:Uncharacterized protein n=1 Tax=Anopheles merus TaxID=30066 RepID=A0A182ULR9_ANOME